MKFWLSIFVLFFTVAVFSQSKKVTNLQSRRGQVMNEIKQVQNDIDKIKKSASDILQVIGMKKDLIEKRKQSLHLLEEEIKEIEIEQQAIEKEIPELEADLKKQQGGYNKAMKGMVRKRLYQSRLLFVLSGRSLGESFRRFMYLRDYSEWRSSQISSITTKQEQLNEKRILLENTKKSKLALLAQREADQQKLKKEELSLTQELTEAEGKRQELQAIVNKKQQQAKQIDAQIDKIIAEEIAKQEKEAKRQAEAKAKKEKNKTTGTTRKPATSTTTKTEQIVTTDENRIISNNFESNKGLLMVPVTGSYRVIGEYGTHKVGGVIGSNLGIVIRANAGADARCVFPGKVTAVIFTPGEPVSVLVSHGVYFTYYSNIQSVYVSNGQTVSAGQALGKIYTDAETGFAPMEFQIWKGRSKMNPRPWLKL